MGREVPGGRLGRPGALLVPQGRTVKTIIVEIDAKGTAMLKAHQVGGIDAGGQSINVAMEALDVAMVLTTMVRTILEGLRVDGVKHGQQTTSGPDTE